MKKCIEMIEIDSQIAQLDKLDGIYRAKVEDVANRKTNLLEKRNKMVQAGYCSPIAKDKKDPTTGKVYGQEWVHATTCQHQTENLNEKGGKKK